MSDWKRTTKEVTLDGLRPELRAAMEGHIERYNLGEILSDALMCVQTVSEKIKKGLFGGAEIAYTGAVVTPRWLIWAVSVTKAQTVVLSAQLIDLVVQDYAQSSFAKLVPDTGLNISGRFTDGSENGSAFVGLGAEPEVEKFIETVIAAAQRAKK